MKEARQHLIDHISTSPLELTAKKYAGELLKAQRDPTVLTKIMPAALVLLADGSYISTRSEYTFNILVCTRVGALEMDDAEADCLDLTQSLVEWLDENIPFRQGSASYQIQDPNTRITYDLLLLTGDICVYQITLDLQS